MWGGMAGSSHQWDRLPVGVLGKVCSLTIYDWACVGVDWCPGHSYQPWGGWGATSPSALCLLPHRCATGGVDGHSWYSNFGLSFHLGLAGFLKVSGNRPNGLAAPASATQRHDRVGVPWESRAEARYQQEGGSQARYLCAGVRMEKETEKGQGHPPGRLSS